MTRRKFIVAAFGSLVGILGLPLTPRPREEVNVPRKVATTMPDHPIWREVSEVSKLRDVLRQEMTIVNVQDPRMLDAWMASPRFRNALINIMRGDT